MSDVLTRTREVTIGPLDQIPPGEGRNFSVAGRSVAVFRTRADEVFATQARCPHRNGPLADGMLGGRIIMCPLHDRFFNLETGQEIGGDCAIAIFPVRKAEDGALVVTMPTEA